MHEIVHEHDEKDGIYIDDGHSGLGKMHEIDHHEKGGAKGRKGGSEELLAEQVHKRNHCRADKCAGDAPAEGVHAEQGYTGGDEQLAQRRMGILVLLHPLQLLEGGSGVVHLIEVEAGLE